MPPVLSSDTVLYNDEATDIERFRARHRRLCRDYQENSAQTSKRVESVDEDDGRKRKIPAKWRAKQCQTWNQHEDGYWPESAGTEMHLGFNAFDFSASPEAFNDEPEDPIEIIDLRYDTFCEEDDLVLMADVAKQVTSMGFSSDSLWGWKLPGLRQSTQQLPSLNRDGVWGGPIHHVTHSTPERALYYRYYA
ncbi:hypothetical protein PHYSODRAFT_501770 [Phytophthora sojae]|uniref:Uncharacterized protein n=1 Tax=Phytophthora sojae (strain P6497) TaxID=1094619 RepID=G4ZD81_PHYSP|nr:hypothetical protein PHYSODRAFT_501770 [Phytophthora sojae]EGZ16886.1 hypothetical protein PHYSODRAFT_501770 [Phytophthora sojae]|eukprot:XP_009525944.1 hypothetical protein PHYSODRAFT_501770 [Phytophthora sojae]